MKTATLAVICLAMLASNAMAVGDKETEALLARMRHVYSGIRSVAMEITTIQTGGSLQPNRPRRVGPGGQRAPQGQANPMAKAIEISTTMLYAAPFDVFAKSTVNGFPSLRVICDGRQIATIQRDGVVAKQPATFQNFVTAAPLNLESICFFDWRRQLSTDKGMNMAASTFRILKSVPWNGKKWTVLEETARAQGVVCLYYIDPATDLIWRTTSTQIGQNEPAQDYRVTSMKINAKVPAEAFVLPKSQFIRI